jgi:predicted nucleic acid-binding protein
VLFVFSVIRNNLCNSYSAVDGKADFLVTGDEDLLSLKEIEGIPILSFNQLISKIS